MTKRFILALVLLGYSALLIEVVVFKSTLSLPGWARWDQWERVDAGPPGRGPGRGRGGRAQRPDVPPPPGPALPTSRFAPLHANYVPFKTIWPQLRGRPRWSSALINLVGNTALFVPVGFLALLVWRNLNWPKAFVLAVGVGVTMEVLEGVFRVGVVDVDDVILNALGVMGGCWLGRIWQRRREPERVPPA